MLLHAVMSKVKLINIITDGRKLSGARGCYTVGSIHNFAEVWFLCESLNFIAVSMHGVLFFPEKIADWYHGWIGKDRVPEESAGSVGSRFTDSTDSQTAHQKPFTPLPIYSHRHRKQCT